MEILIIIYLIIGILYATLGLYVLRTEGDDSKWYVMLLIYLFNMISWPGFVIYVVFTVIINKIKEGRRQ